MHDNYDLEELLQLVEQKQFRRLRTLLDDMNWVDIAEFLDELGPEDTILVFPTGKGSTGGSYLIYDTIMNGNGPKCMLNLAVEQVTAIGCIMGEMPLIDRPDGDVTRLIHTGDVVTVDMDRGTITF